MKDSYARAEILILKERLQGEVKKRCSMPLDVDSVVDWIYKTNERIDRLLDYLDAKEVYTPSCTKVVDDKSPEPEESR